MNYLGRYTRFLKDFFDIQEEVSVVFDFSNGTAGIILEDLIKKQKNIHTKFLNKKPDGKFPSHSPNPLEKGATGELKDAVKRSRADLGVIFDADGDRAVFIDDKGRSLDSNEVFVLLAPLFRGPYIIDVQGGREIIKWLSPKLRVIESKTGTYFVKKKMREKKIKFGAEYSGHYYFKNIHYSDSGIMAAILVINQVSRLKKNGVTLSQWRGSLPKYYRYEVNIKIQDKQKALNLIHGSYKERRVKISKRDGVTAVGRGFWINVRPSNTEPLLRISVAAKSKSLLDREKEVISRLLR